MSPSPDTLATFQDFAEYLARIGGAVSLDHFRRAGLEVERKADESPVTVADRSAEQAMRAAVAERFPDHGIVGEEFGGTIGERDWEWIIDPIDGTKSYVRGVPLYTTLVALLFQGQPMVGVIHCPPTGETVSAARGAGARDERGRGINCSSCSQLEDAWLMVTDPTDLLRREPGFGRRLMEAAGASRTWADGYGYLLIARGDADLMVDPIMNPWDIAALGVIVREAGGLFTDIDGNTQTLGDSALAASTPELHAAVMELR